MFRRIILGIIITVVGALVTIYANKLRESFGTIRWAEKYLSTFGGTRMFYKLLGVVVVIIGLMHMTGLLDGVLKWVGSKLGGG